MINLYEESDLIHNPFQCFYYNSTEREFPLAPHWHYYLEMIYVIKGSVKIEVENKSHIVSTGEMIIFHPKAVHAFYQADEEEVFMAGIKLDLNSMTYTAHYSPKLRNIFLSAEKKKAPIILDKKYTRNVQLEYLFHQCVSEIRHNDYGYNIIITANLYKLLILIVRFWQQKGFSIDSAVLAEEENYDILNILPYISDHLDSDLKVTDIAAHCGLSYSYFAKKFQEIYGKSCKEYIEDMRIYKAEELLLFTDFDLTHISQITGFSDCSHLIKSFKARRGVTPKQFRLANRK